MKRRRVWGVLDFMGTEFCLTIAGGWNRSASACHRSAPSGRDENQFAAFSVWQMKQPCIAVGQAGHAMNDDALAETETILVLPVAGDATAGVRHRCIANAE